MATIDNAFLSPSQSLPHNMFNASWAAHGNNLTTRSRSSSTTSSRYVPQDYLLGRKTPAELLNPPTQGGALIPLDETSSVRSYEPSVPEQYAAKPYNPRMALQPYPESQLPLGGHIRSVGRPRASTESRCSDCSRSIRSYQSARSHRRPSEDDDYHSNSDRDLQRSRSHKERRHLRDYDSDRDRHRSSRSRRGSTYDDSHTSSSSRDSSKSKDRKEKDKLPKRASSTTTKRRSTYVNASNSNWAGLYFPCGAI